ncbi:leucine carboxyl methyltransferase, putative [Plasmodium vinckei vinckei]|uniref:Leucine carboxyl methyltransferase 1 n=1 Tax=Plasmodium vinckei vinckei TaxID=54757 RepID=A0A449BXA9_PLAVN|nr:leucine carboxyl methyltransferase, putative [Plasmodium vinckei vinckei]KEG04468.1 hypothetical protein YYE_00043 [Plasmodium vinckei vinckei]VEV58117.1 leucine carboxyl methyltransferase, putative [Plasmodium vinckei vinckei]
MDCTESSNKNVQGTTYEASSSKLSAIELGYYDDPYMQYFVKRMERRSPLINRGYYSRVAGVRKYIDLFVKSIGNDEIVQVVNIGAGLDPMFFWIYEHYKNVKYYELDFYEVLNKKTKIINNVELLKKCLISKDKGVQNEKDLINCENYKMVSFDLNNPSSMETKLTNSGFDVSLPTIFLSECVFIYLEVESSDNLIKTLSGLMKNIACVIVYEQFNPNTAFGTIMINYFNQRGITLKSIHKYNSLELQIERYKNLGWSNVYINDMNEIYDYHISFEEKKKIEKIEMFDEFEEWRLFQNHYFILVAFNCHKNIYSNKLKAFLENKKAKGG